MDLADFMEQHHKYEDELKLSSGEINKEYLKNVVVSFLRFLPLSEKNAQVQLLF